MPILQQIAENKQNNKKYKKGSLVNRLKQGKKSQKL